MDDVLIIGAGPAGAVAATVLARGGARVRILDRATFPRDKLCGDTLNPGTLAVLRRLGLAGVEHLGRRIEGMLVTGQSGDGCLAVEARYPRGLAGRSMSRRDLDWALLQEAIAAGARFEPGVVVREALFTDRGKSRVVCGVTTGAHGGAGRFGATAVIAADGRRSRLAFGLGLSRQPVRPRRWAIGAYFVQTRDGPSIGEMHIRRGRYIGVAPIPGGLLNVCLVQPSGAGDADLRDPEATLRRALAADPILRDRFADAPLARPPIVLGPVAVDATGRSCDGLLLAGDAAGFIDPMTGDGLRFAIRGGELAALAAERALERGWSGVHRDLAAARHREFNAKWLFNRTLRAVVASPLAVRTAAGVARLVPGIVRAIVVYAGDCGIAAATLGEPLRDEIARPQADVRRILLDPPRTPGPQDAAN